jgi:DNA-binding MarR family transcriptional regulator
MEMERRKRGRPRGRKREIVCKTGVLMGTPLLYLPDHPRSNSEGYYFKSRYLMEQYLGRYLRDKEMVFHKDKNKENCVIENLYLVDKTNYRSIKSITIFPILCYIYKDSYCIYQDIKEHLFDTIPEILEIKEPRPSILFTVRELVSMGLITRERCGRKMRYMCTQKGARKARECLNEGIVIDYDISPKVGILQ